ncbi:MAG: bile acid:sodium symporter [Candidatus Eremiobacteraeota bacterium]|nr:bile acid:sodium symporter [Candidatus Eremiobacteraeota bacterium]
MNRANLIALLKDWWLLARAIIANFIIVPVLGVLLVRAFRLSDDVATGVLLMAIAPGGLGVIMSGGRKHGGSLDLAVSLALIFGLLSFITIPITAPLVLPAGEAANIPAGRLISILLFQVVPLLLGTFVAYRAPAVAERLARPFTLITYLGMLVILVIVGPKIWASITTVYGSRGMLTELTLIVLSLITGYLAGGPLREHRRTLSLGTAVRVFALALAISTAQFPGTDVTAAVLTYFVLQVLVSLVVGAIYGRTAQPAGAT